jgi:single-strand DNA-binding protein
MATRSLNKVMLIGNLTRDPNLRYTPNNTAVCSFGIATNRTWVGADGGEKQERVDFHNIVAWSKLADICGQLLHKGDKVYVEGRLQTRDWKGDDGVERKSTEIVIDNMLLLRSPSGQSNYQSDDSGDDFSGAGDDTTAPAKSSTPKAKKPAAASKPAAKQLAGQDDFSDEDISDDVPF